MKRVGFSRCFRPGGCGGLSLVEMMVGVALLALIVALLGQITSAFLQTLRLSQTQLDGGHDLDQAAFWLRRDLENYPLNPGDGRSYPFYLEAQAQGIRLAVVRPDFRSGPDGRAGFARHVLYQWNAAQAVLYRREYHSADDLSAPLPAGNGAAWLRAVTPAWRTATPWGWLEDSAVRAMWEATPAVPLLRHLWFWQVRGESEDGQLHAAWHDPHSFPRVLELEFGLHPRGILPPSSLSLEERRAQVRHYYVQIMMNEGLQQ